MFTSPYLSRVRCHMSCVTCQMSRVTCHMSPVIYIYIYFLDKVVKLVREGSVINRAYPVYFLCSLPRLFKFSSYFRCPLISLFPDLLKSHSRPFFSCSCFFPPQFSTFYFCFPSRFILWNVFSSSPLFFAMFSSTSLAYQNKGHFTDVISTVKCLAINWIPLVSALSVSSRGSLYGLWLRGQQAFH